MTNKNILDIAIQQSALDLNCEASDLISHNNKVVLSIPNENARKYLTLPFDCNLVSYGNNIVASVRPDIRNIVKQYIEKYPTECCFETPNFHVLNDALYDYNLRICFMAEYFLPDLELLQIFPCEYQIRILHSDDFSNFYKPEWSNALCEKRKHLDILGVGAYDNDKLIGLACCSADCNTMWQIGIDVLPSYRRQGIASALTSKLTFEIINRGKVPFYCAAWSNLKSIRNAIKSGFRPAWIEMTAKSIEFISNINK